MYQEPLLSILVLDYLREKPAKTLMDSLKLNLRFKAKIIYLSNSPDCDYAKKFLDEGKIDTLIIHKNENSLDHCIKQLFSVSTTPFSIFCRSDCILSKQIFEPTFRNVMNQLSYPSLFYVDLSGHNDISWPLPQAFLIQTQKYLYIPSFEQTNEYMKEKKLFFVSKPFFKLQKT